MFICGYTFSVVQHMTEELGCVTHDGMKYTKLYSVRSTWSRLICRCVMQSAFDKLEVGQLLLLSSTHWLAQAEGEEYHRGGFVAGHG